jgi:hypothetical protein
LSAPFVFVSFSSPSSYFFLFGANFFRVNVRRLIGSGRSLISPRNRPRMSVIVVRRRRRKSTSLADHSTARRGNDLPSRTGRNGDVAAGMVDGGTCA